jgi:hypothetical protein
MSSITLAPPTALATIDNFTTENWEREGAQIINEGRSAYNAGKAAERALNDLSWRLGDWLLTGEVHLKEGAYQEAERITKKSRSTLYDYARIARAFPAAVRDAALSWTHYKYLTPLEPATQQTMLAEVREHKMSSMALRKTLEKRGYMECWRKPPKLTGKKASTKTTRRVKLEIPKDEYMLLREFGFARGYSDGVNGVIRHITRSWIETNKSALMREVLKYQEKWEEGDSERKADREAKRTAKLAAEAARPAAQTPHPRKSPHEALRKELYDRETQILRDILKEKGKVVLDDARTMLLACVQNLVSGELDDEADAIEESEIEALLLMESEFIGRLEAARGTDAKISLMKGMLDAREERDRAAAKAVVDEIKAAGKQAAKDRRLAREAASKQEKAVS